MAPGNALGVVLAKAPAALMREDALTAAMAMAPQLVHWATSEGGDAPIRASPPPGGEVVCAQRCIFSV
jgi:hypothetical protein